MLDQIKTKLEELNDAVAAKATASEERASQLEAKIEDISKQVLALKSSYESKFSLPGSEAENNTFSFAKAIKASITGDWSKAGFEKECSDAIAKSVNVDSGAAGGFLAPTQQVNEVIDLAIATRPVLNDMGIDIMRGLQGMSEITFPKLTARQTAMWVGSEGEATESNPTFGEISIRPKYLRGLSVVSRELLKQEPGLVEPIVRRELGNASALAMEQALIYGTGTNKQPKGIVNYSSVQTEAVGTNGGRFTWKIADNMVGSIEEADHSLATGRFGFVTHPKIKKLLRQEQVAMYSGDTDGQYRVGVPVKSDSEIEAQLGYLLRTTTLVPSNLTKGIGSSLAYVIFGDWSQIMLGIWGQMEIRTSVEAGSAFTKNQIYIASFLSCDINVKDETKFCLLSDAATSV